MKITMGNAIYVQKNDIGYLLHSDLSIPKTIFMKASGRGIGIVNNRNRYEFVKFEEKEEIAFFKELDYIVDYDDIKNLSVNEIIQLASNIIEELSKLEDKYNAMSMLEKKEHIEISQRCDSLEFKFYSLLDVAKLKQGKLRMQLPDEIFPSALVSYEEKKCKRKNKIKKHVHN